MIQPWIIWIAAGIICIILEIFTPKLYFIGVGIGAVIAGLFSFMMPGFAAQIIVFILTSVVSFLWMKRLSKKLFSKPD